MIARRVGILGGTFDPIHVGHTDLGRAAQAALELTCVLVIPANIPPHRPQPQASASHRFAMAAFAVAHHATWRVSDLELRGEPPSYTSTTLTTFHERGYAPAELFFIVGADAFLEIGAWKDYPGILDRAHFAIVSRPGFSAHDLPRRLPMLAPRMTRPPMGAPGQIDPAIILIDFPTADVSSTAIRQRRVEGGDIGGMVAPEVQQHIEQHGLYTSMTPGRRANDQVPAPAAGRLHGRS